MIMELIFRICLDHVVEYKIVDLMIPSISTSFSVSISMSSIIIPIPVHHATSIWKTRDYLFKFTTHERHIEMRNVTIHEKQEPIVLTCKRCQNVWEYHGNNPYVAKCSFCKTTVPVLRHKQKATASGLTLAGTGQNAATTTPTKGAAVNDK